MNKGLPKLSDEFKPRESSPKPVLRAVGGEPARPASERAVEKVAAERPAPERRAQPVERPAPMAPRIPPRPLVGPGAGQRSRAQADESGQQQAPAANAPQGSNGSPKQVRPVELRPSSPGASSGPREAAQPQPAARPQQPSRPVAANAGSVDEFGERLRAQREAAERLVQQRLAAARQKAAHANVQTPANGELKPKPEAVPASERPRFTFADEEIAAAKREVPQPPQPPSFGHVSPPPYVPSAATYTRAMPRAAADQARLPEPFARNNSSPYPAAKPEPLASYRPTLAAPAAPAAEPLSARAEDTPRHQRGPRLEGERRPQRRGGHSREVDLAEDDLDDAFEERRSPRKPVRARAKAADYSAAYRGYEDDYEEEEPRRRSGPLILLLSLVAVAVVAGGLIYWYKQQQPTTAAPATGDVPVVTAPQEPVKATPEPATQQQAVQQPQGRKQIYDRILGEETLEPERIVPTEEQPQQQAPLGEQPQTQQPQAQQPQTQQPQVPPAGQNLQPQNSQQQGQGLEPLPLPLPPPPGTGEQGQLLTPSTQSAKSDNVQVPEPAASTARELKSAPAQRQQAAPAQAQQNDASSDAASLVEEPEPEVVKPKPQRANPEPASKPRKQAEGKRSSSQSSASSDSGSGPIQIAPIPLAPQPQPQPTTDQTATLGTQPQALQTQQAPAQNRAAPRRSREGEIDPLEGVRAPNTNYGADQPGVGKIANTSLDPQPTVQPAIQTIPEPTQVASNQAYAAQQQAADQLAQQAQVAPAPQPQRVAVAEPQPQPQPETSGSGGYVVQLASYRSEAEALSEFQRLSQRHPNLVGGMGSRVQRSDLGASGTFYRLGVGPVASKDAASQLCNSLIAAGEKDCLVRRQ